jgi:hypothetical protein
MEGTEVSLMGRFGVAEPAIREPQDAGYDKQNCRQFACVHIYFSLPRPTITPATFQRLGGLPQLPQVKRATAEQSDESNGNQVKSYNVVQQPRNDQN